MTMENNKKTEYYMSDEELLRRFAAVCAEENEEIYIKYKEENITLYNKQELDDLVLPLFKKYEYKQKSKGFVKKAIVVMLILSFLVVMDLLIFRGLTAL